MRPLPEPGQLTLAFEHAPSHAEEDFILGAGNRLAFDHIMAWPNWAGPLTLITGPAQSGKSHLARIWAERSGAAAVTPEQVGAKDYGGENPLVIEDADRLPYDESALFHLLNQSMREGRPVLMTARLPVTAWPYRTDDLKSRARLAATFAITGPDDTQLSQILVKLFGDRQLSVEPKVIAYMVGRMERSAAAAVALVEAADRVALERRTGVTRSVAATVLGLADTEVDD